MKGSEDISELGDSPGKSINSYSPRVIHPLKFKVYIRGERTITDALACSDLLFTSMYCDYKLGRIP